MANFWRRCVVMYSLRTVSVFILVGLLGLGTLLFGVYHFWSEDVKNSLNQIDLDFKVLSPDYVDFGVIVGQAEKQCVYNIVNSGNQPVSIVGDISVDGDGVSARLDRQKAVIPVGENVSFTLFVTVNSAGSVDVVFRNDFDVAWVGFVVWDFENINSAFRVEGDLHPVFANVTEAMVEKISYAVFNDGNVPVSVAASCTFSDDGVLSVSWDRTSAVVGVGGHEVFELTLFLVGDCTDCQVFFVEASG